MFKILLSQILCLLLLAVVWGFHEHSATLMDWSFLPEVQECYNYVVAHSVN